MTIAALYAILKFWLPLLTLIGLMYKIATKMGQWINSTKTGIGNWANQLLDNHMTHIQAAVEQSAASLKQITDINREISVSMREMKEDNVETRRTQTAILTGIEVLKAKVD